MPASLSILTLSRNLSYFERLAATLAAFDVEGMPAWQGVLVNNTGSAGLTRAATSRGWAVVKPGYNMSFSAGNNAAAKVFPAPWLLLLNDDVIPEPGFLPALWAAREKAELVGAKLVHANGLVNHAGGKLDEKGCAGHLGRYGQSEDFVGCPLVPRITFAAALIRRQTWELLGGLDERYNYGHEDSDFCLRALQAGASIRCERAAVAVHDECGTRPRGGLASDANARIFVGLWQTRIVEILRSYQERVAPEHIEGIEYGLE